MNEFIPSSDSPDSFAVRVTGLVKAYHRRPVLRGLELHVPVGAVYGLVGVNGAGKSTLLRCLVGLCHPDAGFVTLLGHRLPAGWRAVAPHVGAAIELPAFYPFLSGAKNLEQLLLARTGERSKDTVAGALERAGLEGAGRKHVRNYSKGMRQRLTLAFALLGGPDLVVLDEPTEGLDPFGRHDLRQLLAELRAEGRTVLFSSHVLSEVEDVADRVGILHEGRLVAEGSPSEIVRQARAQGSGPGLEAAFIALVGDRREVVSA